MRIWRFVRRLGPARGRRALRSLRHADRCFSITARLMLVASLLAVGVCGLVFRADKLTMGLSIVPVLWGGALFFLLGLAVPGLIARRPARIEAWTLPTVFVFSVAGATVVNEGGVAPLVVIGDAFRSDFLWLQPWFLGLVWLSMVGWLGAALRGAERR